MDSLGFAQQLERDLSYLRSTHPGLLQADFVKWLRDLRDGCANADMDLARGAAGRLKSAIDRRCAAVVSDNRLQQLSEFLHLASEVSKGPPPQTKLPAIDLFPNQLKNATETLGRLLQELERTETPPGPRPNSTNPDDSPTGPSP